MVESLVINEQPLHEEQEFAFDEVQRNAVYRAIGARRDVRRGYLPKPLPEEVLTRLLMAAHSAPSVGLMQPSRFVVIRSREIRERIKESFREANEIASRLYEGEREEKYKSLKLEGILDAPQNLCILCDTQSTQGYGLGRQSMPETVVYSTVCAVQNLWLAARAEGVGVGWVSILSPASLRTILNVPAHVIPVAYLCLGYVDSFGDSPELEQAGWERRVPLERCVSYETFLGEKP